MAENKFLPSAKGQGLPLNVIIIALIVLVVLVVVWLIFTGKIGMFSTAVGSPDRDSTKIVAGNTGCVSGLTEANCVKVPGCYHDGKECKSIV
ncbi:hypothetical protein HYU14_01105 [Candidatus Woesearchaeota archaeon]|nr:hypothetical protein [Candidatus Woesearchaeota archaeon]